MAVRVELRELSNEEGNRLLRIEEGRSRAVPSRTQPLHAGRRQRLRALRASKIRHGLALAFAIQRGERTLRAAEALDAQFDRRFPQVAQRAALGLTTGSQLQAQATACATTASVRPPKSLDRSERSAAPSGAAPKE